VTPFSDGRPSGPYLPGDSAGGQLGAAGQPPGAPPEPQDERAPGPPRAHNARALAPPDPEDERALGPDADPEAVARKILLDQLTGQARSRAELAQRLAKRNVPDEIAARLLDRFEEVGLVDDEAFARAWVQSRQPGKGLARRALAQELRRKGIEDDTARVALDEIDPEDEVEAARTLVRRKLRSVERLGRDVATRRLTGMLARKGYPSGLCFRVVREELEAVGLDGLDLEHDG
jgi:regulatory protein